MCEDEVYVTCVCGELVNVTVLLQHIEDCFKEDFITNTTSLKISKPCSYGEPAVKIRQVCGKCVRCGYPMYTDEGTVITFYPSIPDSAVMCGCYNNKSGNLEVSNESTCKMCKLPNDFHQDRLGNKTRTKNCIDNTETDVNNDSEKIVIAKKYRQKQAKISECLESLPDDSNDFVGTPEQEHSLNCNETPKSPACKSFHVALLPNYNKDDEDSSSLSYSLHLQILDSLPPGTSVATQTDLTNTAECGVQVKILGVYPEEVLKLLSIGKNDYDILNFDPALEAAFRSHISTLISCNHCSRTFSPDRIQKHMSCCIERPRPSIRECITPIGGEIPR